MKKWLGITLGVICIIVAACFLVYGVVILFLGLISYVLVSAFGSPPAPMEQAISLIQMGTFFTAIGVALLVIGIICIKKGK